MCELLKASWRHQGKVFFAESTLHGVRYIAEAGRPLIERLLWFACVTIGAISTMVVIMSLWEKFQTNPTITGLDTDFHNWDIPFPAVSLCASEPWNATRLHALVARLADEHQLDEAGAVQLATLLRKLTQLSFGTLNVDDFPPRFDALLHGRDLHQLTYPLMATCEEFLRGCTWKAEAYRCCEGFFPVYTENGFCYTFNALHYERHAPDGRLHPERATRFIRETDAKWSLQVSVEAPLNVTEEAIAPLSAYNISMYLHTADEQPGVSLRPQLVWDFKMTSMSFSMRETYTTADAAQLSVRQRRCIFDDEMRLAAGATYSYSTCARQCRMRTARRLCGCAPHFYASSAGHAHCGVAQLRCIAAHRARIADVEACGCQLGCANTVYEVDKLVEPSDGAAASALCAFEFEFTSWPMIKYKREVLFGWVDLLVSFGGIAGLFLGFSLLSGVEVLYYFTIRACCMVLEQRAELEAMVAAPPARAKAADRKYDRDVMPYFIRELRPGLGRQMLRRRVMSDATKQRVFPPLPVTVRPKHPHPQPSVVPPFGIEYCN